MADGGIEMKCSACGVPLPQKGLVCGYCGTLNLLNRTLLVREGRGESDYCCPLCDDTMERLSEEESLLLEYCSKCDGLLIDEELLEALVVAYKGRATGSNHQKRRFVLDNPRDNRKKTAYYPCPICAEMMQPFNYKKRSGVILELCEEHGIWVDGGELLQICEWHLVEKR